MVLRPYAANAPTPMPWLHSIPDHWEVRRAKQVFRCIDVRSKTGGEELLTVSSADGVRKRSSKAVTMFMAESYAGYKLCWEGDLVVNSLWAWATGLGFSRYHGIISTAYSVYRPKQAYSNNWEFFHYLFRSRSYDWEFTVRSKGIWISRLQMADDSFMQMPVLVPPPEEQEQIVHFIRYIDQRVNRLIKNKRRLIELLNEQKQAIIHHAVTRGLDPTVPLKPSGIDWLGDTPHHWQARQLRHVTRVLVSNVDKLSDEGEEPVRLCNYVDVYKNEAISEGTPFMCASASREEIERFRIRIGDVIITKDSEVWYDIGVPAVVRHQAEDLVCGYHLAILRPTDGVLMGEFLLRCLQDRLVATQFHVAANGITRYGLSQRAVKSCLVPIPPIYEQIDVVDYLQVATRKSCLAITKARSEIDLIREYRTRLVADVVTGQLDVRHLDLPEVDESLLEAVEVGGDDDLEVEREEATMYE